MKINFNSYDLGRGGGNRTILELTDSLVDRGHKVTITHLKDQWKYMWYGATPKAEIINLCYPSKVARAFSKFYLRKRHYCFNEAYFMQKHIPDCDVNVATWWETAYPTVFSGKGRAFYLVQHYEPWFHPEDVNYVIRSTLSYQLPLTKLCVSNWLTEKVGGVFVGNGVNLEKFKPLNLDRQYDVMVMPRNIKWKGNYTSVVEKLRSLGLKVLVVSDVSEYELVQAYNLSKVFLYLSEHEGFGFPPLESLACGTVVISTPCTEFLRDNTNAFVLPEKYSVYDITSRIEWLIDNKSYRDSIVEEGFRTVKELDFQKTVDRFESAIEN